MVDKYRQPNHVDQRVNYHDTLQVDIKDYAADQHYHVDRHRKQNRLLRTSGVIEGIEVTKNADSTGIEITRGIAVDHEGRLIILNGNAYYNNRDLSIEGDKFRLSLVGQRGVIGLFIAYYEKLAYAPSSSPNRGPADRWQEQPELEVVTPGNKPRQERAINLATITLSANGQIESIDLVTSRQHSETRLSSISFSRSNLSLRPTDENSLSLTGSLRVSDALNARTLNVARDAVVGGVLSFSGRNRQLLSFGNGNFGIGVQEDTQYFRTAKSFAWYKDGAHSNEALNPGGGSTQMVLDSAGQLGIGTSSPKAALDVNGEIKSSSLSVDGPIKSASLGFRSVKGRNWTNSVDNNSVVLITHDFQSPSYPIRVAVFAQGHALVTRGTLHVPIRIGVDGQEPSTFDPLGSNDWGWGTALIRAQNGDMYPIQSFACFDCDPNRSYTIEWALIARVFRGTTGSAGSVNAPIMLISRSSTIDDI